MIIFNEILKINKFIYFLCYFILIVIHIVVYYSLKNDIYFKEKKSSFERITIYSFEYLLYNNSKGKL